MFEDQIEEAREILHEVRVREVYRQITGEPVKVVGRSDMQKATQTFLKKHGLRIGVVGGRQVASTVLKGKVEVDADLFGQGEYISALYATQVVDGHQGLGNARPKFPSTGSSHSAPPAPGGLYTLDDYLYYTKTFLPAAVKLLAQAAKAVA